MNLLLIAADERGAGDQITIDGPRAAHLRAVLKVVPGRTVRIGIINGPLGSGTVRAVDGDRVTLQCAFEPDVPPRPPIDLLLALPRPKVMRRLWAQLAAIGVGRIILTNAARVERNYFDTHVITPRGYEPLLIEGLQQARDTRVPVVTVHRQFRILVEDELEMLSDAPVKLMADPDGSREPDRASAATGQEYERVLLAVGPEGGWNGFERKLLFEHGFLPFSLGPRTLRTDTACIALLTAARLITRSGR